MSHPLTTPETGDRLAVFERFTINAQHHEETDCGQCGYPLAHGDTAWLAPDGNVYCTISCAAPNVLATCPACHDENPAVDLLGWRLIFRCRSCGMEYGQRIDKQPAPADHYPARVPIPPQKPTTRDREPFPPLDTRAEKTARLFDTLIGDATRAVESGDFTRSDVMHDAEALAHYLWTAPGIEEATRTLYCAAVRRAHNAALARDHAEATVPCDHPCDALREQFGRVLDCNGDTWTADDEEPATDGPFYPEGPIGGDES